jgi:hypothetical protein
MPVAVSAPNTPSPALTSPKPYTNGRDKQMVQSREDSVYLAKLAEQAERYEGGFTFNIQGSAMAHV